MGLSERGPAMTEVPVPSETVGDIQAREFASIPQNGKLSGVSASWPSLKRLAITVLFVSAMSVSSPGASSWATPPQIPAQPGVQASCSYRLDPPRRTDLPFGVTAVTTTMTVTGCQGEAQPVDMTACIQADGIGMQCRTGPAWIPAELTFRPWRAGLNYTARGTGCFLVGNPPSRVCTPTGPLSVGL